MSSLYSWLTDTFVLWLLLHDLHTSKMSHLSNFYNPILHFIGITSIFIFVGDCNQLGFYHSSLFYMSPQITFTLIVPKSNGRWNSVKFHLIKIYQINISSHLITFSLSVYVMRWLKSNNSCYQCTWTVLFLVVYSYPSDMISERVKGMRYVFEPKLDV